MIKRAIFLIFLPFLGLGQSTKPEGRFMEDSVQIAKPIRFSLSLKHPEHVDVFFPDKTFNFSPFELVDIHVSTTMSAKGLSKDSAVYTLKSLETKAVQHFALPVWIMENGDSIEVYSTLDSVFFKGKISPNYRSDVELGFFELKPKVDFFRLIQGIFGLLCIFTALYLIFRKQIDRWWQVFNIWSHQSDFLNKFDKLTKGKIDHQKTSAALNLWKSHLQFLTNMPYQTFTTKEIIENIPSESLESALKEIDMAIYADTWPDNFQYTFSVLKNHCRPLYKEKLKLAKTR